MTISIGIVRMIGSIVCAPFFQFEVCGFDQATMAQSLYRYISIIGAFRQGQQKIRTFAVSCLLTSWIKKFSSPKISARG